MDPAITKTAQHQGYRMVSGNHFDNKSSHLCVCNNNNIVTINENIHKCRRIITITIKGETQDIRVMGIYQAQRTEIAQNNELQHAIKEWIKINK